MTLSELRAIAANFAGDKDQTRYNTYTLALNLAQQQFSLDAKCLFKDYSITIEADTANYSLPDDFIWDKKVTYKGEKLDPISRETIEAEHGDDWTDDEGDPIYYIIDPEEDRKEIRVYPYPPAGDAGGTLVLTYFFNPEDMSDDSDEPFNSYDLLAPYQLALPAWAAWYLLQSESPSDPLVAQALSAKKKELLQIYNDQVSLAAERFQNTVGESWRMRGSRAT